MFPFIFGDFPPEPMDSWEIPGRIDLGKPEAAGGFQVSLSEYDIQQVNKLDGIEDRM